MAIAATSPVRTGARRPWRSDQRPNTGLMAASMPAEIRNAALIPSAPQPSSSSRSGATTEMTRVGMRPARRARSRTRLRARVVRPGGRSAVAGPLAGSRRGSPTPRPERDASGGFDRKGCRRAYDRREPAQHRAQKRPGDRRAHGDADQLAATFLRRRGDQPREAAVQAKGPYTLAEARDRTQALSARPNATLVATMIARPVRTVVLTPASDGEQAAGSRRRTLQTRRQPTGRRAPTSRGRTRPRTGSSGARTPKNIDSRRTVALTRVRPRPSESTPAGLSLQGRPPPD